MKTTIGWATLAVVASAIGCAKNDGAGANLGEIDLALSLPGGVTVTAVAWKVLSSSNAVLASGSTNTSNPSATPSVNVSVPQGTGDTVNMTATTSQGVSCSGTSAPFNVAAGVAVPVSVTIACGNTTPTSTLGSVVVSGVLVEGDNCPALTAWVISPQETAAAGGTIDVSVSASDADSGEVLSYAWSATAGSFVSPTSPATQYTCAAAGDQTLTVTVSDNHQPAPCTVNVTFPPVRCL